MTKNCIPKKKDNSELLRRIPYVTELRGGVLVSRMIVRRNRAPEESCGHPPFRSGILHVVIFSKSSECLQCQLLFGEPHVTTATLLDRFGQASDLTRRTNLVHQDLVLDVSASTGGGGRVMESYKWELYDWTVEQESDAPSAEFDYAEEASAAGGSSKLTIPGAGRESENELTWYFNITATNWLGGIGWTSIEVGGTWFPGGCRSQID